MDDNSNDSPSPTPAPSPDESGFKVALGGEAENPTPAPANGEDSPASPPAEPSTAPSLETTEAPITSSPADPNVAAPSSATSTEPPPVDNAHVAPGATLFEGAARSLDEVVDDILKWIRDVDRVAENAVAVPTLKRDALATIEHLEAELKAVGGVVEAEFLDVLQKAKAKL